MNIPLDKNKFGTTSTVDELLHLQHSKIFPTPDTNKQSLTSSTDNPEWGNNLGISRSYFKMKRDILPMHKRYWIPFRGPKSIVYPHAWLASQIRRSVIPKNIPRSVEVRTAEKKEEPVNSYMHFGRR